MGGIPLPSIKDILIRIYILEKKTGKLVHGIKWSAIERVFTQFIQLVIMIIMARILGPKAYGLVGMLSIFIAISQTLVDSGFSSALIRKKKVLERDYSTVFVCNFVISLFAYIILFICSRRISLFFNETELELIVKALGLVIVINSLTVVHKTRMTILMDFKTQSKISILSVLVSGVISIALALLGFGVWALVINALLNSLIGCFLYYIFSNWKPKINFSMRSFRCLFSFGSNLLIASLLNTTFDNIYQFAIGKYYSVMQVGYFSQAKTLTTVPTNTFSAIIQRVSYRYLTELRHDNDLLSIQYTKIIKYVAVIFFPLMTAFSFFSEPIIMIVLGGKWSVAAQYSSIMAFCYMFYPIHAINLNLLNVVGRSDLFLKLEIAKKILISVILIFTVQAGIKEICYGMVLYSLVATYINSVYTSRFINIGFFKQLNLILPVLFISVTSFLIPYLLSLLISNPFLKLSTILLGAGVYLSIIYFYDRRIFISIFTYIKG